jgi:hypothetical protein
MLFMNWESLRQKLLSTARAHPPSDRVPYAFQKRIMARLVQPPVLDFTALWASALWRAAAPCIALALLLGVWSFVGAQKNSGASNLTDNEDFVLHFERTMLADVNEPVEERW